MKIILCTFLLCITAVSVFGQSVLLKGIVGQSVKFPAEVKEKGSLMYGTLPFGDVTSGNFTAFSGRVQWDSSTGFFSLSGLKMEDIGEYKVQNTDQNINTVFQLNVYKDNVPVSKPHVNVTRNEYRCTLLCTVENGTRATLSWYREGEKESYGSSPVESAPHLYLPLPVERSGTYTCKAKNSVSNETSDPLTVGAHCTAPSGSSTGIIVASVIAAVVVVLIAVGFGVLYWHETMPALPPDGFKRKCPVKKIHDNVDPHEYDETMPALPQDGDAVQAVPQSDETMPALPPDGFEGRCKVKKLLDNVDPQAYDEEEQ